MASREILKKKKGPKSRSSRSSVVPEKQDEEKVLVGGVENTGYEHNPNASTGSLISVKEASESDRTDNANTSPHMKNERRPDPERPLSPSSAKNVKKNSVRRVSGENRTNGSSIQGSAISLRSQSSAKEAWTDTDSTMSASDLRKGTSGKPRMFTATTKSGIHPSLTTEVIAFNNGEPSGRSLSQATLVSADLSGDQHAYVPYLFARNCIVRIMDDMKNMKLKHVHIVTEIEGNFRGIEKETQNQFNSFVVNLKQQYANKVQMFRNVIDAHRNELSQKQNYWEETLMALSVRNKKLLQEKKGFLEQTKSDQDMFDKEKADTSQGFVHSLEDKTSQLDAAQKEIEKLRGAIKQEIDENQKLKDLLEQNGMGHLAPVIPSPVSYQAEPAIPVVAGMTPEEAETIEREREGMKADRVQMMEERDQWVEERNKIVDERNNIQGELNMTNMELLDRLEKCKHLETELIALQTKEKDQLKLASVLERKVTELELENELTRNERLQLSEAAMKESILKTLPCLPDCPENCSNSAILHTDYNLSETKLLENFSQFLQGESVQTRCCKNDFLETKELSQVQARYDSLKDTMLEVASVKAAYDALRAQYAVLAAAAVSMDKEKAEEKAQSLENDKKVMEEEKGTLETDIKKWEEEFVKENEREPTEGERPDAVKELYTQLSEVDVMLESIDKQQETLQQIQAGNVPQPAVVAAPIAVKEPAVKTVEVKVVDQEILSEFEETKTENAGLKRELSDLKNTTADLRTEIGRLKMMEPVGKPMSPSPPDVSKEEQKPSEGDAAALAHLKAELREKEGELRAQEKEQGAGDEWLKRLLAAAVSQVHEVHAEVERARELINERLGQAEEMMPELKHSIEMAQSELEKYVSENAHRDDGAQNLEESVDEKRTKTVENELIVTALRMLQTGDVPSEFKPSEIVLGSTTVGSSDMLEDRLTELESENAQMNSEKTELLEKIAKLETDIMAGGGIAAEDTEGLSSQLTSLQKEVDSLESELREERAAHDATKEELEAVKFQVDSLKVELNSQEGFANAKADSIQASLEAQIKARDQEVEELRKEKMDLEKARMENLPVDTKEEMEKLHDKISRVEKEKTASAAANIALTAEVQELKSKVDAVKKNLAQQKSISADLEGKLKANQGQGDKVRKELEKEFVKKEQKRAEEEKKKIAALERKLQMLGSGIPQEEKKEKKLPQKATENAKVLKDQVLQLKKENNELNAKVKTLEAGKAAAAVAAGNAANEKRKEKILKELEKKLDLEQKKATRNAENLKQREEELKDTKKENDDLNSELKKLKVELSSLGVAAKEGIDAANKVKDLESDNKKLKDEVKVLGDNFNSERVLRKKYYNMVEDMKGKIRVYCRARPLSKDELNRGNVSVIRSPDEYTINVESSRGLKEFQFDTIFMPEIGQEKVFEDTNNLVQSAVDGYNVCIFAYGQTGSGKTFTMIGDRDQNFPGIAPRAFQRIFELIEENKKKFTFTVSCYMMELYNDKLLDLFIKDNSSGDDRYDIKKDKKGMVFIQGAEIKSATTAKELYALFDEGSKNRHVASTMMNAESSRSHLIIGVVIESVNKTSGNVLRGKLSLVDLAGSERVAKTGATAQQLKEANSINKSLSALGDVISALSSEQSFIPYRNNKLTMLMQDSLGGNAKTLMFVNISPADYNADETTISLTYASRVKLITNDAQKNADNKEITRLKGLISKLKQGERVDEEV